MNKEVKVTLGVAIQGFVSGLNSARSAFGAFTGGIRSGVSEGLTLLAHLGQAVNFVGDIFRGLANAAKSLFDTFVSGIAIEERLTNQFIRLVGNADQAKAFLGDLASENQRLGFVTDDMLPSINQFATALKAMDGAVKPERLGQMADMFRRIKAARPDLSADEITRAILQAARGDVERIKMLMGVGLDDVTGLSEKAQKTMAALKQTSDMQVGEVIKVVGGVKPTTQDLLDLFDEYLDKLGMTQEATEETKNDWERNVARLGEIWDNFKDKVGAPILEALNNELVKLSEWLEDHQEEIDAFAKKLGEIAAEGLTNAMEALMEVDWEKVAKSGVAFAEAFSKVDWANIAKIVSALADYFGETQEESRTRQQEDFAKILGLESFGVKPATPSNDTLGNVHGQGATDVNVTIKIDDDAKLSAVVENKANKAANNAIGDLVNSTTKGGGGAPRGKK